MTQFSKYTKESYFLLIALFLFVGACDNPKESRTSSPEAPNEDIRFEYSMTKISERANDCSSQSCSEVIINLPTFTKGISLHETLNKRVTQNVKKNLSDLVMQDTEPDLSLTELARRFIQSHEEFKANFPESTSPWYVHIDVLVGYSTDAFVSLSVATSSYTGGAHPNSMVEYINISKKGEVIEEPDFFVSSENELKNLAEQKFRQTFDIPDSLTYADKGYLFENNEFQLTSNFGFTKAGMVFYYNSYEIAPYAMGPSVLIIPFHELNDLISQ
ncbi:uncharacterized protein DUF4163 [Marinoscillum furvescens DSM 4134]|uniref:Uncharacterized protein DUF4163 n=2 Tax=Marinoscillum furvescens TaxID=1026 RepID=A0A3D9L1M4_MARFU|nr:uncharacterized protein DUF4163 [Marinoscillum furvescens DSM 4134]